MTNNPIVISGPSGSGKTELINYIEKNDSGFVEAIGATTRKRRETDDNNMSFISRDEFEQLIKTSNLIEYTIYNGNYYGVSKEEFKKLEMFNLIFNVSYTSAKVIQQMYKDTIMIYLLPPNKEELLRRLGNRDYERYLIGIEETIKYSQYYTYLLISKTNNLQSTFYDFMDIINHNKSSEDKKILLKKNMNFINSFYN